MPQQRATATKKLIKQAFSELIAAKGIEGPSVSDIARRAGVNRGTFYLHYTDKYDLLHKLENEALEQLDRILFAEVRDTEDPRELVPDNAIRDALRFVQADATFFTALTGPGGDPEFVDEFKRVIGEHLYSEIERSGLPTAHLDDATRPYARELALGGIVAVIVLWLRNGAKDSVEFVSRIIEVAKRATPLDLEAL